MTDIVHGERFKKVIRNLLKLGFKYLKKDMTMMSEDLKNNSNPVIKNLHTVLLLMANNLHQGDDWQKKMVLGYGQGLLWNVTKDTAYRDPFFWGLDKLLEHADELRKMLKPYVKPPEEWIANLWEDSKKKTRHLRRTKQIPMNANSFEESMYTPAIQDKRHKKYFKKGR